MDIDLARTMVRTAFESGRALSALLPLLKAQLSPEDYQSCAHDLAEAIDKANTALISRATKAHPELVDEIDTALTQNGHY